MILLPYRVSAVNDQGVSGHEIGSAKDQEEEEIPDLTQVMAFDDDAQTLYLTVWTSYLKFSQDFQ